MNRRDLFKRTAAGLLIAAGAVHLVSERRVWALDRTMMTPPWSGRLWWLETPTFGRVSQEIETLWQTDNLARFTIHGNAKTFQEWFGDGPIFDEALCWSRRECDWGMVRLAPWEAQTVMVEMERSR